MLRGVAGQAPAFRIFCVTAVRRIFPGQLFAGAEAEEVKRSAACIQVRVGPHILCLTIHI